MEKINLVISFFKPRHLPAPRGATYPMKVLFGGIFHITLDIVTLRSPEIIHLVGTMCKIVKCCQFNSRYLRDQHIQEKTH